MDRHRQSEALKSEWRDERELSPRERAQEARHRLLDAVGKAGTPAGKVREQARRDPLASLGLALLAGFVFGYSPEFRDMFMTGAASLVQVFLRKG